MKEIIYLDTELMNSMIAQLNRGVTNNYSREQSTQESQTAGQESSRAESSGLKGEIRFGTGALPGGEARLGGNLGNDGTESTSESHTMLEGERDILNKQFHDYSLDILNEMLNEKELLKNEQSFEEGDIIKGESTFRFYDYDILVKSVNPKLMEKIMLFEVDHYDMSSEKAEKIATKVESGKKLTANEELEKETALMVHNAYTNTKSITRILRQLEILSLYGSDILGDMAVIKFGNKIGLLEKKYLREGAQSLSFRTDKSRKVKYLVRVIGEKGEVYDGSQIDELSEDEIDSIPNMIFDILLGSFNIMKEGDLIVKPIAIYYE